ncbi:hypothetical protein ACFPFV_01880 [Salinicoccus siamensis]|uniref:Uncharacterized protein n=1 Tax=Salinicoccus siamensis TaxID=381830 RepID=A0ABV5Z684_9STAP
MTDLLIILSFMLFGIGGIAFSAATITTVLRKLGVTEYPSREYWRFTIIFVLSAIVVYIISVLIRSIG